MEISKKKKKSMKYFSLTLTLKVHLIPCPDKVISSRILKGNVLIFLIDSFVLKTEIDFVHERNCNGFDL